MRQPFEHVIWIRRGVNSIPKFGIDGQLQFWNWN